MVHVCISQPKSKWTSLGGRTTCDGVFMQTYSQGALSLSLSLLGAFAILEQVVQSMYVRMVIKCITAKVKMD